VRDKLFNAINPALMSVLACNMDLQPITDPIATLAYILAYVCKDERAKLDQLKAAIFAAPRDAPPPELLRRLGNTLLRNRQVSKQEAQWILLAQPLYWSSRATVFVAVGPLRTRRTIARDQLAALPDDSNDIWATTIVDRYIARPAELEHLTLFQFSAWFEVDHHGRAADAENRDGSSSDEDEGNHGDRDPDPPIANPDWQGEQWVFDDRPFMPLGRRLPRFRLIDRGAVGHGSSGFRLVQLHC
jgi:hypothetical protein